MVEQRSWWVAAILGAAASATGCGGGTNDTAPPTAGSAGMSSGGATTAGSGSDGSGTGGASGGTTAGGTPKSCTGQFAAATPLFVEDPTFYVNGVTATGDELELYYSQGVRAADTRYQQVVRRSRASAEAPFGPVQSLPELATVCEAGWRVNPDITDDGLTLYVTCTVDVPAGQDEGFSTLRVAHRPDRGSAFTLDAQAAGNVFASANLSADELIAYTDGEIFSTPTQMFKRASKSEPFGANANVPGLTLAFTSPDIGNDELAIFGSARAESDTTRSLFRATRKSRDVAFEAPAKLELGLTGTFGAPNITPACNLYFVYIMTGGSDSNVYVARQQ